MAEPLTFPFTTLKLPREFADVSGLIEADLQAITHMIGQQAMDRLLLSHRQREALQQLVWNSMVTSLNTSMYPLTSENN